jgi:hypothetical protein
VSQEIVAPPESLFRIFEQRERRRERKSGIETLKCNFYVGFDKKNMCKMRERFMH